MAAWLGRLLVWTSLLAIPCFLVMRPYQDALAALAMAGLELGFGLHSRFGVDLHEPFSLGLFAALCLASRGTPRRARAGALALGLPLLAAFSVLLVMVYWVADSMVVTGTGEGDRVARRFLTTVLETVPWIAAPALWLLLLGKWELPKPFLEVHSCLSGVRRRHRSRQSRERAAVERGSRDRGSSNRSKCSPRLPLEWRREGGLGVLVDHRARVGGSLPARRPGTRREDAAVDDAADGMETPDG